MDAFEVQSEFEKILNGLKAAESSIETAARYIYDHKIFEEDLYQQILSTIGKGNILSKLNLFFLFEGVADFTRKNKLEFSKWITWMNRDIEQLVGSVVPPTISANANVEQTRLALERMNDNGTLSQEAYSKGIMVLKDRENIPKVSEVALTQKEILARMEQDRERTKKVRETQWKVISDEFEDLWSSERGISPGDVYTMQRNSEIAHRSTWDLQYGVGQLNAGKQPY